MTTPLDKAARQRLRERLEGYRIRGLSVDGNTIPLLDLVDTLETELATANGALAAQADAIQAYCDSENAMRTERDRYKAALERIEVTAVGAPPYQRLSQEAALNSVIEVAREALKGGRK